MLSLVTPSQSTYERFLAALREAREAAELTQAELAQKMGVAGQTTIQGWESGRGAKLDPERVFELEKALGLRPGTLSRHLGYLPVTTDGVAPMSFADFLIGVDEDRLTEKQRKVLLEVYNEFVGDQPAPTKPSVVGDVSSGVRRRRRARAKGA